MTIPLMLDASLKKRRYVISAGVIAGIIGFLIAISPLGRTLDYLFYDYLFVMRGERPVSPNIVVVGIDEPSFAQLGEQWPWSRKLHAQLVDKLFEAGAKTVAFDVLFAEQSDPEGDTALRDAVERHPQVVLGAQYDVLKTPHGDVVSLILPSDKVAGPATEVGLVTMSIDDDGFVRRVPIVQGGYEALSMKAAQMYARETGARINLPSWFAEGGRELAINFVGPPPSFRSASYYQALNPSENLPPNFFEGALVLVGLNVKHQVNVQAGGLDRLPYPFTRSGAGYTAGVMLHAHAASSILEGSYIRELSDTIKLTFAAAAAVAFPFALAIMSTWAAAAVVLIIVFGTTVDAYVLLVRSNYYLPAVYFVIPIVFVYVSILASRLWITWNDKQFIRRAFSTYLSPKLVSELINNPDSLKLGGEGVEATVLFLDLQGFTALSEQLKPEELITVVNRFLGELSEIVVESDGMIDKFIGDAIMAVWGAPFRDVDHAERACRAALKMKKRAVQLARHDPLGKLLKVRIGINSGMMVAGNVGGGRSFNYTVLGNQVNLASRLEGANKHYGSTIIVGEETAKLVSLSFELRELDRIRAVGKTDSVVVFELLAEKGELDTAAKNALSAFEHGRREYESRDWEEAVKYFKRALELQPDDIAAKIFLERCRNFKQQPPPDTWDAVFELKEK
ncbi:MAG: CHASE2 domain-containing protein [Bdellovibrionales bacterium]|nr:CHASE2 domain-containing protein [Bdellovibrionales bacterium]